ncbi:hypothetical protein HAX54_038741, partial [Datura stramonium]|nr:hypothetical protein [Datura stramonium]
INEGRRKEGKNHNNVGTALDRRSGDPDVRTATSGHKKAQGWDFKYLTGGHSGEPLMQNRVPPVGHRYNTYHLKNWSPSGGSPIQFVNQRSIVG